MVFREGPSKHTAFISHFWALNFFKWVRNVPFYNRLMLDIQLTLTVLWTPAVQLLWSWGLSLMPPVPFPPIPRLWMATSPRPSRAHRDVPLLHSPVQVGLCRAPRHCPHPQKGCNPQSLSTPVFQEQRWIWCLHSPTSSFQFHADVLMSTCLPQSQIHGCSWRRWKGPLLDVSQQ